MRISTTAILFLAAAGFCRAQDWPKSIITGNGTVINLYQPEVLSWAGNSIASKSVISVKSPDDEDPVFGLAWITATVGADSSGADVAAGDSGVVAIQTVKVDHIRLTDDTDRADLEFVSAAIEVYMPWVVKTLPAGAIRQSLQQHERELALTGDSSIRAPQVLYRDKPTVLVPIDGEPRLERNARWGVDAVVNSRYVIVRDKDERYYLYGGGHWYSAPAATGPYAYTGDDVSRKLRKIAKDLRKAARKDRIDMEAMDGSPVYQIAVSTVPALLIQTDGPAEAGPIPGTRLGYILNSGDDIFVDSASGQYFVLAGGQWYRSASLTNSAGWRPVDAGQLPSDFARIPAGSPKAGVREAVAGTPEHQEAGRLAQVPQTMKVDRLATTEIDYDGAPRFSPIPGTHLTYATNTCSIVLSYNGLYYALDNGVWFVAGSPLGRWEVSTRRPADVESIPHGYRAYAARFVYVYEAGPDVVYEGYLPGYDGMPGDDCALAESYSYAAAGNYWSFDLDCVFGWGGGWYEGFYWFTGGARFYGYGGGGHWRGKRPWAGGSRGSGQSYTGGTPPGGGFVAPRPPRGWQPRIPGNRHVIGYNNGWAGSGGAPRHVGSNDAARGSYAGGSPGGSGGTGGVWRSYSGGGGSRGGYSRGGSRGGSRGIVVGGSRGGSRGNVVGSSRGGSRGNGVGSSRGSGGGGRSNSGSGHASSGGGHASSGGGGGHSGGGGGGGGHSGGGGGGHSGGGGGGHSGGGHH